MATIDSILVLRRDDLSRDKRDLMFDEITHYEFNNDLRTTTQIISIVMFIDDNGESKILKNR